MKNWGRFLVVAVMSITFILSGCGGGGGGDSSPVPIPSAPAAPANVAAAAGHGEATIGWDNVTDATSYNLYYSQTAGVTKATGTKIPGVISPRIVTSLTNGTTYYFVVTAVNANGESAESSQVSAIPTPNPPPAAPANAAAVAGHGEATISWDNVTGATSYNLYYSQTAGVTKATGTKIPGVTSPSVITPLTNNVPYFFVVTAVNANGESAESSQVTATPTSNPPPAAPTNVVAAAGSGQASISWDNVAGATSYNLYYSQTTGVTKSTGIKISGVTSPKVVASLIRGVPYFFVVTAVNADGESAESSQVTATPNSPNPTFIQGDLSGIWNVQVILSGATPGWYRFTASVDGAGNVTISNPSASSGVSAPTISTWSITPGTGLDNTVGVVKEAGTFSNATFQGKMSSSKNLMIGTSTYSAGTYALHVFLKRNGAYSNASDLANKTFGYNAIFTNVSNKWEIGTGSTNAANPPLLTYLSVEDSTGPQTHPPTTISVDPTTGVVTIGNESTFLGMMSTDKKIIVGTSTDASGNYSLRIIQLRGQTYSETDLVGQYLAHSFQSALTSYWARGTWTVTTTAPMQVTVNATNIINSDGSFDAALTPWTQFIDAQGGITLAPPNPSNWHGLVSFNKDMVVLTGDSSTGSFMTVLVE